MSLIYQAPVVANSNNNKNTANSTTTNTTTNTKPRPGIYIGDKNDAKNYKQLIQRNITYILNVTPPKEACYKTGVPNYFEQRPNNRSIESSNSPPSPNFHYLRIPIYDSAISMTQLLDSIPTICTFINQAIQYNQSSILIHCQRGISRSVTVAILYMIRCLDMSYHDAITMIQRRRPQAQPIPEFVTMLQEFEITCRQPTLSLKHVRTITTTINTSTGNNIITDGTGTNEVDDVTTLGTTAANVSEPKMADNHNDDVVDDQNHRNRSKTNSSTGSNRIVGPQRPPLPTNMTIPTTSTNTENDGSVAMDENGRHKRRKLNQNVGPQRPPST